MLYTSKIKIKATIIKFNRIEYQISNATNNPK